MDSIANLLPLWTKHHLNFPANRIFTLHNCLCVCCLHLPHLIAVLGSGLAALAGGTQLSYIRHYVCAVCRSCAFRNRQASAVAIGAGAQCAAVVALTQARADWGPTSLDPLPPV